MEKLIELLFQHGGLVQLAVFVVPGFIAWKTYQLRRPQGEQRPADAFIEILTFSALVYLLWYAKTWTAWPRTLGDAALFAAEVFATPIVVALVYQRFLEFCARRNWVTWPHPRAWDFIFNALPYEERGTHGLFLIVTLKDGYKVAGLFSDPSYASLWPYDRDLFLGPVWQLEADQPVREVLGSVGLYVSADAIQIIEVMDYAIILENAAVAASKG